MLPPFALRPLDAQLCTVELHDGRPPDVPPDVCDALLRNRDVIEALRRGVQLGRWPEDAMPYSVGMLDAVPGLRKLAPDVAASLVAAQRKADGALFYGGESVAGIKKRARMAILKNSLVSSIRKRARTDQP